MTTRPSTPRGGGNIAIGFVTGMLSRLPQHGVAIAPLLKASGIGAAATLPPRVRLEHYTRLYNLAVQALDDEGFGLFSRPLPRDSFEFLCRAMLGAPNLAEAIDRASRFLRLVLDDLHLRLHLTNSAQAELLILEKRRLAKTDDDPARIFAFEWLLRLLHSLMCWFSARILPLSAVDFPYPRPAHADDYSLVYTARPRFGAPTLCAYIPRDFLTLPLRRDEAALAHFLRDAPGKISHLYRRDREMVQRVRNLLREQLALNPTLDDIAAALNLSSRTLARRLHEEDSGFRAIKDALRRDIATARLARSRDPISRLAAELGYSDPSTFYRAFTAWTGEAPERFRRRRQGRR